MRVVQKQDQCSGRLTEGMVSAILTNSPTHPHGIKDPARQRNRRTSKRSAYKDAARSGSVSLATGHRSGACLRLWPLPIRDHRHRKPDSTPVRTLESPGSFQIYVRGRFGSDVVVRRQNHFKKVLQLDRFQFECYVFPGSSGRI